MTFTAEEKLKEVLRELAYRNYVYPRRIMDKKMTEAQAARQIGIMHAIAADYQELANKERLL